MNTSMHTPASGRLLHAAHAPPPLLLVSPPSLVKIYHGGGVVERRTELRVVKTVEADLHADRQYDLFRYIILVIMLSMTAFTILRWRCISP